MHTTRQAESGIRLAAWSAHQVLQWPELLDPFHSRRWDQQPVVVGAGMEVAHPPGHLVGHNGAYGSIQLVTMGLPEMYCFQMPQTGSHSICRWNTEIISADPGQCLLSLAFRMAGYRRWNDHSASPNSAIYIQWPGNAGGSTSNVMLGT